MSNIAPKKISDSMMNKAKEKAEERPSNKRSVWDVFTKEEQPDGSEKAKCNNCGKLLSCNSKKHGTSQLRRHLKSCNSTKPPNKDARTTPPSYSSGNREIHLGNAQQRNTEPSGNTEHHLGNAQQRNTESSGNREHHLGNTQQRNTEPSGNIEHHLGNTQQRNTEPSGNKEYHLGYVTEPSGLQENYLDYDLQKNRELFVKMVIDNKSMLEHVENPFLEEFARFLQPLYSHVTRRDVEEDCLTFYKNEKAQLKEKITNLTSKVSLSMAKCYNPKDPWSGQPLLSVAAHFIDNDFKLVKRIIGFVEFNARVGYDTERILNDWGLGKKAFARTADLKYCPHVPTLDVECILKCFCSIASTIYNEIRSKHNLNDIERMMKDLNEHPEKMCYFNEIAAEHNLAPKSEFVLNNKGVLGSYLNILNDACTYKNVLGALDDRNVRWGKVEEVVRVLNRINDVVVRISSLEFPTSNLLLKFVFEISDVLSEASSILSDFINRMSLAILDDYLARCDKIVLIASVLDPQFKFILLKRYIEKIEVDKEDFNKFFCSLYNKYQSESTEIYRFDSLSQIPELNKYFERSLVEEGDVNFDVLGWWKDNKSEYPILSRMARDILAIPISSWLTSGTEPVNEIIDEIFDSTVHTEMSKVLVCCNNWLRSGSSAGKSVAGIENIIEKRHLDQGYPEHSNKSNSCVYDQIKCLELLAKLVISSELPFHFVKSTWFTEWAKNLQPLYTPVDLASIKSKCLGFYQIERERFKSLHENTFENSAHLARVCFSVHEAKEFPANHICVTAHFIDNDFNLVRRIIGIKNITTWDPSALTAQIQRCIDNWELPKKVLAFTTEIFYIDQHHENNLDGLTYGVGAIKLHCIVHGLFNVLLTFIRAELGEVFGNIREMIKFFAENPNAMHIIKRDDMRRWDSTLDMLCDALAYKDVFDACFPLCGNWNEVESAIKLLRPIYEAITILSSSQYPTSNLFLKIVFEIHDVLSHVVFNTNNDINKRKFLDCLMEISDSYLKDCNNILLVASLLDPRFKSTYLERCYTEHISDREEIEKCIGDLCNKFKIKHDRGKLELERYLQEGHLDVRDGDFDVLRWWKDNQSNYPILSRMARYILAIPVCSLPSELAFSTDLIDYSWGGSQFIRFRKLENKLGPRTLEALVCSYNWLSDASSNRKCVQKGAAIDLVEKHIPPSYKCPLRVCDMWSISFLEHGLSERMSEKIVAIGGARLIAKNMQCLIQPIDKDGPDNWIRDDVINCYIDIMNNKGSTSGKILKLSTFDSQLLQSWGSSMGEREKLCERISNIIDKGNGFLQNELVFLPIHVQNHWFVGVLNALKKEFQILNSINSLGRPYEDTTHKLRLGIQVCIDAALDSQGALKAWRPENVVKWPISVISSLPQQKDGCSCGLFALKYMQLWDGSKLATEFTQDDIDLFRKQLVGELIFSELNEMKNIQDEIKKRKLFTEEPEELEDSEESEELQELLEL